MENVKEQIQKLKAQTESLDQLIELGDLYLAQNDKVEARHYYMQAIEKFPNDADGYLHMGNFSYAANALDEANNYYDQATALNSSSVEAWLGYAKTHYHLNGLSRAEEYCERALTLEPENAEVLLYAGITKFKLHKIYYAEKYLEKAEQIASEWQNYIKFYLALVYAQKDLFAKAIPLLEQIKSVSEFKSPNDQNLTNLLNNLGLAYFRTGKMDDAQAILEEAVKQSNADAITIMNLAIVYWVQDKIDQSVDCFKKAQAKDPTSWPWLDETAEYIAGGQDWLKGKIQNLMEENADGYNIVLYLGCVIPNRYPFIEAASRHVLDRFKIGVLDAEGASCCPAPGVFRSFDIPTWLSVAARNISISEEQMRDLVTMCNGCYGTLNDVNTELQEDKEKKEYVNQKLKTINREYKGSVQVRHIIDVLYNTIGVKEIKKHITNPIKNLKVAVHYGCHILKPSHNKPWDRKSAECPTFLDELVEVTGAQSIDYRDKLMCCGAGGAVRGGMKEVSLDFTRNKLENMRKAGVDAIVLCCPFCHLQFDLGQMEVNGTFKDSIEEPFNFPVIYYTQLLGLAMGMDPYRMGLLKTPKQKGLPPFTPVDSMFTRHKENISF